MTRSGLTKATKPNRPRSESFRSAMSPARLSRASFVLGALVTSGVFADSNSRRSGEQLFRTGLDANGQPVQAVVAGNLQTDSTTLRCSSCHGGSGMGTAEAGRVAAPIRWRLLTQPGSNSHGRRAAYDVETVRRAIQLGVDSEGRALEPLMPRYAFDDATLESLLAFLKARDELPSPGLTETSVEIATIVTPDADREAAASMQAVLAACVRDINDALRHSPPSATAAGKTAMRSLKLAVWQLKGDPTTWQQQLQRRYKQAPVFAVVSGIGATDWMPVHEFCDQTALPCLLPNIDFVPANADGGQSLYFSRGLQAEVDVIAAALSAGSATSVVQIFKRDAAGSIVAQRLRQRLTASTKLELVDATPVTALNAMMPGAAVVLWLDTPSLAALPPLPTAAPVFVSSTFADGTVPHSAPLAAQGPITWIQPFALGDEWQRRSKNFASFMRKHRLQGHQTRVEEQTWFACRLFGDALLHVSRWLDREYLFETLDHVSGPAAQSATYPHLSFGPGQRYTSKGVYSVPVVPLGEPRWIVP